MRLALPATLAGLSLLLLGGIAYESFAPLAPVIVEVPRVPKTIAPSAPTPVFIPPPESDYADIDARPVFSAARKPLADSTQAAAATASSDFSLAGVIMDANRAVALIRSRSANTTTSAVLGDSVAGWRVVRIEATAVTLHDASGDAVITIEGPAARPAGAPLPAPAVAAPTESVPPPSPPAAAATPAQIPVTPATPAKPGTTAAAPPAKPGYHPYINPDALKGSYTDPKTGEVTL
jgi:hypothetical protein